jgi:hypothetical protein
VAKKKPEELTEEELAGENAEELPAREAMSVIRGGMEYPLPSETVPDPAKGVIPIDDPRYGA